MTDEGEHDFPAQATNQTDKMLNPLRMLEAEGWTELVWEGLMSLGGEATVRDLVKWGREYQGSIGSGRRKKARADVNEPKAFIYAGIAFLAHSNGQGDSLFEQVGDSASLTYKLVDALNGAPTLARIINQAKRSPKTNEITGLDRYLLGVILFETGHFFTALTFFEQALATELDARFRSNAERLHALCLTKLEW